MQIKFLIFLFFSHISYVSMFSFPTYKNYFPNFKRTDCSLNASLSDCNNNCPQNCLSCTFDGRFQCLGCLYGYYLTPDNYCVKCPENCLDCVLNINFWNEKFMCTQTNTSFYYNNQNNDFLKCSDNCASCISATECKECLNDSYYLKFNNINNFSCYACIRYSNCSTCLWGNSSDIIGYSYFLNVQILIDYYISIVSYNWGIICKTCPISYVIYEIQCVLCSDLINYCSNCSFTKTLFRQPICYECSQNKVVSFQGDSSSLCIVCPISNCAVCGYSIKMFNSTKLMFIFSFDPLSLYYDNSSYIITISCYQCQSGYGFGNNDQTFCRSCPQNCESCYLYNNAMFCGSCQDGFILNIYSGICQVITDYTNITGQYINSCSKIISENPWFNEISGSFNFLCQKCKESNFFPNILGYCIQNQSNCMNFFQGTYSLQNLILNYTDLLLNKPLLLKAFISKTTFHDILMRCLSCESDLFGYNSILNLCCSPQSFQTVLSSTGSSCNKCSKCDQINFDENPYCTVCDTCSDMNSSYLMNDDYINNSTYLDFLYQKKIYLIMITEGKNLNTMPILNDTIYYLNIFNSLNEQKSINFGINKSVCLYCPISALNCTYKSDINETQLISSFSLSSFPQLSYYTESIGCKQGFVFDYNLKRCKFCPNNWTSCESYKEIKVKFLSELNNFTSLDNFTVSNMKDLDILMRELENSEFSYIMNEFAVKSLKIIIEFDTYSCLFLNINPFDFSFKSILKEKINSLNEYSILFQPLNFDSNNLLYSNIYLACSFSFSGYTSVSFQNIAFYIVNYYLSDIFLNYNLMSHETYMPGLFFSNIQDIQFLSCQIKQNDIESYKLYDLIFINDHYNKQPLNASFFNFYFEIKGDNTTLTIRDFEINMNIQTLLDQQSILLEILNLPIFYLSIKSLVFYNIRIKQTASDRSLFIIEMTDSANFSSVYIENLTLNRISLLILNSPTKFYFINSIIINLNIIGSNLFAFDLVEEILVANQTFLSCDFVGDNAFQQYYYSIYPEFKIQIKNVSFISCYFTYYEVIYYYENDLKSITSNNIRISSFLIENSQFICDSLYQSSTILFFNFPNNKKSINFENIILLNNSANAHSVFFIFVNYCQSVNSLNIFMINCLFSGLNLQNTGSILVENFLVHNNMISTQQQNQYPFLVINLLSDFKGRNISFSNIYCVNSLMNFKDWSYDDSIRSIILTYISFNNISIYPDREISSGIAYSSLNYLDITITDSIFNNILIYLEKFQFSESSTFMTISDPNANLTIDSCLFINNYGNSQSNIMNVIVINLEIKNCVFNYSNYIDETNFLFITAKGSIGNLKVNNVYIHDSIFFQCIGQNAGAFYFTSEELTEIYIESCKFLDIFSSDKGGVFYFSVSPKSGSEDSFLKAIIINCKFQNTISMSDGGIVYISSTNNTSINFLSCNFSEFYSEGKGSIVYGIQTGINMFNCCIYENSIISDKIPVYFQLLKFTQTYGSGNLFYLTQSKIFTYYCQFYNLAIYGANYNGIYLFKSAIQDFSSVLKNISYESYFYELDISSSILNNTKIYNIVNFHYIPKSQIAFIYTTDSYEKFENIIVSNSYCPFCETSSFLFTINSISFIVRSYFFNNTANNAGIFYFIGNFVDVLGLNIIFNSPSINESIFENNFAFGDGGCIVNEDSWLLIYNNTFLNNQAPDGCGGAIYFMNSLNNQTLTLINNSFINNSALYGGAIYYQNILITLIDNNFINNFADFGLNIFSSPKKLKIFDCPNNNYSNYQINCSLEFLKFSSFRSGDNLPTIYVQIYDEEDNPLNYSGVRNSPTLNLKVFHEGSYTSSSSSAQPAPKSIDPQSVSTNFSNNNNSGTNVLNSYNPDVYSINSQKEINLIPINNEGVFEITNIYLIGTPNTTANLIMLSDSILLPNEYSYLTSNLYYFSIIIDFRECYVGEIYERIFGDCKICTYGMYSYNRNDALCSLCLEGLNCTGGNQTKVLPGYWRDFNFSESIIKCENDVNNCIGGFNSGNSLCLQGHVGPRCEDCDLTKSFWNEKYARSGKYSCGLCESSESYQIYLYLTMISLMNFFYMALSIKGTLDNLRVGMAWQVVKLISRYSMIPEKVNESGFFIKIYMTYLQIIMIITTFRLSMPDWVTTGITFTGDSLENYSNSLDCVIPFNKNSLIPLAYTRLIINLILPYVFFLTFSLCYIFIVKNMKNINRKYELLYSVALFTLLYFQPTTIRKIMSVISCNQVGNKYYIKSDLSVECYSNEYYSYTFYLAVPALLFITFIIPLFVLYKLFKKRKQLKTIKVTIKYGYLYTEYHLFYWEFVKMYQKIMLIIVGEYYDSEINIKGLLSLLIIGIYYVLDNKFEPYKKPFQNKIDKLTTLICFGSIFFGLFIYEQTSTFLESLGYVLICLLNIIYNMIMIRLIANSFLFKRKNELKIIQNKLIKISKCFSIFFQKEYKTTEKWVKVRRLTARYLREKERRKLFGEVEIESISFFNLSLIDYDPSNVGIKRKNERKKAKTFHEGKKNILDALESGKESNVFRSETFDLQSGNNSRNNEDCKILIQEEKRIELQIFLEDTLKKVRLNDDNQ